MTVIPARQLPEPTIDETARSARSRSAMLAPLHSKPMKRTSVQPSAATCDQRLRRWYRLALSSFIPRVLRRGAVGLFLPDVVAARSDANTAIHGIERDRRAAAIQETFKMASRFIANLEPEARHFHAA